MAASPRNPQTQSPSSSSSSSPKPRWKYDVFLSFRGQDTRKTFADHLYTALINAGIRTFRDDDELQKGESIEHISTNSMITDPFTKGFHPNGEKASFNESTYMHPQTRCVLGRHEAKFLQKIVKHVLRILNYTYLHVAMHPVGIQSRVRDINPLLNIGSDDVRMIGIYGMGGVGKTTIAKAVYNQYFEEFEGCCFLANVREVTEQPNGYVHLQEQLLSELLKIKNFKVCSVDRGIICMKERLCAKKVLIVLDDLNNLTQVNSLAGEYWRYKTKELKYGEPLELFSLHAFKERTPFGEYFTLSKRIVDYVGGLPLALEVLGGYLYGRTVTEWNSAVEKLRQIPNNQILEKLRISYDGLDDDVVKDIFLDIACFFIGMDKDCAINILSGCEFFPDIGIPVLINRSLLTIDEKGKLMMHNLIRDMGREIVQQESRKKLGKRSRLWDNKDFMKNLKILNLSHSSSLESTPDFTGVPNLETLFLNGCTSFFKFDPSIALLHKLTCLILEDCKKLINLPDCICKLRSLENLNLNGCSNLEELLENIQNLEHLRELFADGTGIKQLPDSLGHLKNLTSFSFEGCDKNLPAESRHSPCPSSVSSIGPDSRLLPASISNLCSLRMLNLSNRNLSDGDIPASLWTLSSLQSLRLDGNNFDSLLSGIAQLSKLELLSLNGCRALQSLSEVPPKLVWLHATGCTSMEELPILSMSTNIYTCIL
ncbi:hypothetical protein LguiA_033897 [Lonicera macranthoides]